MLIAQQDSIHSILFTLSVYRSVHDSHHPIKQSIRLGRSGLFPDTHRREKALLLLRRLQNLREQASQIPSTPALRQSTSARNNLHFYRVHLWKKSATYSCGHDALMSCSYGCYKTRSLQQARCYLCSVYHVYVQQSGGSKHT